MRQVEGSYPIKLFIRHKAKQALTAEMEITARAQYELPEGFDDALFQEITRTLFRSNAAEELDRRCRDRREAAAIEDRFATEIASIYRTIKQRSRADVVQQLNQLL